MGTTDLYALALYLVPDLNAAGDLFMASRSEADLRRRAAAWRRSHGLPPVATDAPVAALDVVQRAYALHLVERARQRRVVWTVGWIAIGLLVVLAVPIIRRTIGAGVADPSGGQVTVRQISGKRLPDGTQCGDGNPEFRRGAKPGAYQLRLSLPYSPAGPEPQIDYVGLAAVAPTDEFANVWITVRAEWARPDSNACYLTVTDLRFPRPLKAKQVQFHINVAPGPGGGMSWYTSPVPLP